MYKRDVYKEAYKILLENKEVKACDIFDYVEVHSDEEEDEVMDAVDHFECGLIRAETKKELL